MAKMGWKTLKNHFNLQDTVVQVKGGEIWIGSGYAQDLIVIDIQTGERKIHPAFPNVVNSFKELIDSSNDEILELLKTPDTFTQSLPVFTYEEAQVIELACEDYGYPNVTHCGRLMYMNLYHKDKKTVIAWAKENALQDVRLEKIKIARLEQELLKAKEILTKAQAAALSLDETFPDIQVEESNLYQL